LTDEAVGWEPVLVSLAGIRNLSFCQIVAGPQFASAAACSGPRPGTWSSWKARPSRAGAPSSSAASATPILVGQIDPFLAALKTRLNGVYPELRSGEAKINFHVYGKNGVMGKLEPEKDFVPLAHDVEAHPAAWTPYGLVAWTMASSPGAAAPEQP
jgi:hypothetical protein